MTVDYREPGSVFDWPAYGRGLARVARRGETLRIEPGRAVTAYCGWYLTRVLDVKRSQGKTFAVLAGGTHHLRTPAAKGHDQPFAVIPVDSWPHGWERPGTGAGPVALAGQLCTPKDILARDVPVTRLRAGDLMIIGPLPGPWYPASALPAGGRTGCRGPLPPGAPPGCHQGRSRAPRH
jgi:diaminopimelate decarboxylase